MPRIFAYIVHKSGVVDDSAAELLAVARAIDPTSSPTAILTGWGPDFDLACRSVSSSFGETWKISNQALAYPNAEFVRQALVRVVPSDSIVLIAHDHFGIDLAPGLSIKLNAAYASDVLAIDGVEGNILKLVRQEFGGQVSTHVCCDASSGAVINVRPGAFKPEPNAAVSGVIIDKSSEVGTLVARRRYIETIVAEAGDVDITRHSLLVSIGRGIQEKDNVALAEELAEVLAPYDLDVVATVATMGIPLAVEVTRCLGLDQYVVLHKTPKIHLADAISESVRSITTNVEQRLLFDRARLGDVTDKRVAIVDDVISTGASTGATLRLLRGVGAHVVAIGTLVTEASLWRAALGDDATMVRALGSIPVFRPDGSGGLVEDWNG